MNGERRTPARLRVGVMCYGTTFPSWEAHVVRQLRQVEGVEIALLIEDVTHGPLETGGEPEVSRSSPSPLTRMKMAYWAWRAKKRKPIAWSTLLWRGYRRVAKRLRHSQCDAPADLSVMLQGVPVMRCRVRTEGKYSQYFSADDVATIRTHELDVILRFAFNIIRGEVLDSARYGVWSFHHDDHLRYRGSPPGFWEMFQRDPWTGAMLQRLTDKLDDGLLIHQGRFPTIFSSYTANRNQAYMGSVIWPARACRAILADEAARVFLRLPESHARIYRAPTNRQMLRFFPRLASAALRQSLRAKVKKTVDQWTIGILLGTPEQYLFSAKPVDPLWLPQRPDGYLADPFVLARDGRYFIFVEEYPFSTMKGYLSVIETPDFQTFGAPRKVLETEFHLSYPYVFEHQGEVYCLPEQHQAGKVILYRACCFPDEWEEAAVLIDAVPGVDPTLIQHEGRWWLWLTRSDHDDDGVLYVYHADDLLGPWQPHLQNPVHVQRGRVRPGGRPFYWQGRLLRPAQNGTRGYGGSLLFYAVDTLTTEHYQETLLDEWTPQPHWPYVAGLHNVDSAGGYTVFDAKRLIAAPAI